MNAENHLQPSGRARGSTRTLTLSSFGTPKLEDDNEENIVAIGRAQRQSKLPATWSNVRLRRPGEPAIHVPVYHSAAIRMAKDTEAGEDDLQLLTHLDTKKPESSSPGRSCYTPRVHHSDADSQIRPSASTCKLEEGLSAMGISAEPTRVSPPRVRACRRLTLEHGKAQIKCQILANKSILQTKPKQMLTKRGTFGQIVQLNANYFRLPTVTKWKLYQYQVHFEPAEDCKTVKHKMVHDHKEKLGVYMFNGTVLFSPYKYHQDPLILYSTRPSDGTTVHITIQAAGMLAFGDYHYMHFLNLLMRHCLNSMKLQLVGRNYYDSSARVTIPNYQLELWPGYVTSIRQHENELLLCTKITHKVMRQDTVYMLLKECYDADPCNYQQQFKRAIVGSVVLTDYNNRTYRVDDVDFSATPMSVFDWNGTWSSYLDYFSQKYQLKIRDKSQPMLVSMLKRGHDTAIYLVPELCRMTGLSEQMQNNFMLMKALADCTRLVPSQQMERLQRFNRCFKSRQEISEELQLWNFEVSEKLLTLSGRVMPQEKIILGSQHKIDAGNAGIWTKEMGFHPMLTSQEVDSWVVIVPRQLRHDVTQFVSLLRTVAYSMEFRLPAPAYQELPDSHIVSYVEGIAKALLTCNPRLILAVLPDSRLDRYSAIKKMCCVDNPVPTQLILHKSLTSENVKSIATKVAIQINCKVGGAPWTVDIPVQGLMVVGFDVYHDPSRQLRSVGGLVASLDKHMSQYFSAVSHHSTDKELSNNMSLNICKALEKYKKRNQGCLPQKILIYRDGVGNEQIPYVYEYEVAALKRRLAQVYGENECKMAFVIVTKRINTRLFYNRSNPPPGTVVDDIITLPERYDFFLVSQSPLEGTVTPTSYNVISDNSELSPDMMQRLTYKLTHLYFNWSGTVRVPAPCQYAHRLAYLVGQVIREDPSTELEELLYFL